MPAHSVQTGSGAHPASYPMGVVYFTDKTETESVTSQADTVPHFEKIHPLQTVPSNFFKVR
jgi:hypothetical protein